MPSSIPDPSLTDGEIALRPLAETDLEALRAGFADPDLAAWVEAPSSDRDEDARRLIAHFQEGWQKGSTASFALVEPGSEELLALITLMRPDDPAVAEVAYWVSPKARGQGIATRAVRLVSDWGLEELGIERLWLETEPENAASRRVAEKAGFRREGVFRSHCRSRTTGQRHDCVIFSLLPADR